MGLSSSQARLLNLTARMHQIEYKAARLESQKLQMANESRRVYDDYLNALDATKIQMKTLKNDGSIGYMDATYNNLIAAGYKITVADVAAIQSYYQQNYTTINSIEDLKNIDCDDGNYILMTDLDLSGEIWESLVFDGNFNGNGHTITLGNQAGGVFENIDSGVICNLKVTGQVTSPSIGGHIGLITNQGCWATIENCYVEGTVNCNNKNIYGGGIIGAGSNCTINNSYSNVNITNSGSAISTGVFSAEHSDTVVNCISPSAGTPPIDISNFDQTLPPDMVAGHGNDAAWLSNLINSGIVTLTKLDNNKGNFFETSVAIDTGLQEVSDESELRKAEAKYEADMRKIDAKDRKYDHDLAALDNERNAIKSEMETLKTVAKDNVERTFKLFS